MVSNPAYLSIPVTYPVTNPAYRKSQLELEVAGWRQGEHASVNTIPAVR